MKKIIIVLATLTACFFSLLAILKTSKVFNFSPKQFKDPQAILNFDTLLVVFLILTIPILLVFIVQRFIHNKPLNLIGIKKPFFLSFILFTSVGIGIKFIALLISWLYSGLPMLTPNFEVFNFFEILPYFSWFLITLVLGSFSEEVVYRAYPLENTKELVSPIVLVFVFAIIFSSMHFIIEKPNLLRFLYRLSFGTLTGFIFLKQQSIAEVVGLHTGWNFGSLVINDASWQTGAMYRFSELIPSSEMISNIAILSLSSIIYYFLNSRTLTRLK